ncbi:MAG: hypothetical protein Fur0041_04630 [Bacteroidia bacterium]
MDRLAALEEMLREQPGNAFLRYGIALEYASRGQLSEAITRIESLLIDEPEYLGAYYTLGQYYEKAGETEKAINIYRKGIALAELKGNKKALGELREVLWMIEDD